MRGVAMVVRVKGRMFVEVELEADPPASWNNSEALTSLAEHDETTLASHPVFDHRVNV